MSVGAGPLPTLNYVGSCKTHPKLAVDPNLVPTLLSKANLVDIPFVKFLITRETYRYPH